MNEQQDVIAEVKRKPVAPVAVIGALAVLAGAGFWASARLEAADRTAETRYWVAAGPAPAGSPQPAPGPAQTDALMGRLLPLPERYRLGPDLGSEGNDFAVVGERAVQSFKEVRTGLSAAEREERDKALAGVKLKAAAGRGYASGTGPGFDAVAAEIHLVQADPQAPGTFAEFGKKLLDLMGDDRGAPKIDGFPQAKCVLRSEGDERRGKIDSIECAAVQGDVLVNFRMYGSKEFSATEAATLFERQLNRLKSAGESA
ncbi:hypothetical protein AB0953_06125 [Streptomyces sp. NPDC046866]|uniref:hypothetical protein n=1 Tax=Streptomyces sp. NPDC046866 TaxID=3154921 RepID=UPI0034563960